jgi:hypothetical protein
MGLFGLRRAESRLLFQRASCENARLLRWQSSENASTSE